LLHGAAHAGVTRIDGTGFNSIVEVEKTRLHLRGAALLRYLVFVKAYAGALYLPENTDGSQALDDIMKYLELEYRVAIVADDFAKATRQKIQESVTPEVFNSLLPKIESLNKLYKDVDPGDRYALAYIPGKGTQLRYNSTPLGTIPGADFAAALFGIWIGENPIDREFRNRLLGTAR
jgi:hypothetical protein